jgi:hypothetical protein
MRDAIVAEPHPREALETLEEWLAGTVDAAAALPLATSWALPAADLDIVTGKVRLCIDAYPLEARVLGDLPERASTWLMARLAQTVTPAERLPARRRERATFERRAQPC